MSMCVGECSDSWLGNSSSKVYVNVEQAKVKESADGSLVLALSSLRFILASQTLFSSW